MNQPSQQGPVFDFQLEDVWPILRKQRNVIILFLGTLLGATFIAGMLKTPEYRATTLIHLRSRTGQELAVNEVLDMNTRGYFEIQQFYRTQIQILESRSVRQEVVRRYIDAGYADLDPETGGVARLGGMTTIAPEEQSQLINIHVIHTDPAAAAVLANLTAEVYSDKNLEYRRGASKEAITWLETKITEYSDEVNRVNEELFKYKLDTNTVDVEDHLNTLDAQMTSLNQAYGEISTRQVRLKTTLESHVTMLGQGKYEELAKVLDSTLLQTFARDYASALAEEANLAADYLEQHPKRVQVAARMDRIRATIESEVRKVIEGDKAELTVVTAEAASLKTEIGTVKILMLDYQRRKTEYERLKFTQEEALGFYETLSQRLEEVKLTAQTQFNNVTIIDRALVPSKPSKPNIPMSMAVAFVVGIVGGIGLALVREYIDDTISSQIDVSAYLKVPFLGLIPRLPPDTSPAEADLYTHHNPRSSVAEAVRGLRAMLEMNPNGPAPRRLLVTSSVAREGKTSTAIRLGVAYAQMGKNVVIIDADLRRPRLHKAFGEDNTVGLTSYLIDAAGVSEIFRPTPVPNLSVIFSGGLTDHPAELMASARMHDLLDDLEKTFDIIILDTPPSVALSDAVTLSGHVDGILLVVKEQSVSRAVVKQTIGMMQQVEAKILGVILNNVDLQRSGSKYKYYYAYRDYYSSYAPQSPDKSKAAK